MADTVGTLTGMKNPDASDHSPGPGTCFPPLRDAVDAGAVETVDDGWDCQVLVVHDDTVLRLPRRPALAERLHVEARLLRELSRALPIAVPRPGGVLHGLDHDRPGLVADGTRGIVAKLES